MLAFLHIPKTGGTSIRVMMRDARLTIYDLNSAEDARRWLLLPRETRSHFHVVFGHMPTGVHRFEPTAKYACFLREPIGRLMSAYRHIARVNSHPWHEQVKTGRLSFEVFAQTEENTQTKRLANYPLSAPIWWERYSPRTVDLTDGRSVLARQPPTPDLMAEARRTLARSFVGLFESFDSDVVRLSREFGLGLPETIYRENIGSGSVEIDPRLRSRLEQRNALDMELYEHALAIRRGTGRDHAAVARAAAAS